MLPRRKKNGSKYKVYFSSLFYSSYVADFDSTEDIAFALTSYATDGMELFEYPDVVSSVTLEYLTELLNESFDEDSFVLSVIRPK